MFETAEINIPCPGCGEKNPKTIAWIKTNDHFDCVGCGKSVRVESKDLLAGLKKVDDSVANLRKSMRKFGKRR